MILPCTCRNEYQDRLYGAGRRVHNETKTPPAMPRQYRCTVCENTRGAKPAEKKK